MPVGLALHVVSGEDVELGGQWRPRHRWTANDLTFTTIPLAASSVGIETLYVAIRNYRTASAFTGGSPRTDERLGGSTHGMGPEKRDAVPFFERASLRVILSFLSSD